MLLVTPKELAEHIAAAIDMGICSTPVLDNMYQAILSKRSDKYLKQVNKYFELTTTSIPMKIAYDENTKSFWLVVK